MSKWQTIGRKIVSLRAGAGSIGEPAHSITVEQESETQSVEGACQRLERVPGLSRPKSLNRYACPVIYTGLGRPTTVTLLLSINVQTSTTGTDRSSGYHPLNALNLPRFRHYLKYNLLDHASRSYVTF